MADWITHLGLTSLPARALPRASLRLVLLGAILPDLGTPIVVLANLVQFEPGWFEAVLQPLQAPLPTLMLAVGIAAMTPRFAPALLALGLGLVVHYALDVSQVRYSGGIYLFYPFSFDGPSLDLYWPESIVNVVMLSVGAVALAYTCIRRSPAIVWRVHRWPALAFAAFAALTLCALTVDRFRAENVNNVDFFRRPAHYAGRDIRLGKSLVETLRPEGDGYVVTVVKGDVRVDTIASQFERWGAIDKTPPPPGKRISGTGRFDGRALVMAGPVHVHFRPIRTWTSIVGLVIIALLALTGFRASDE